MKMTHKEHDQHVKCKKYYVIEYVTPNGSGVVKVKTSYYDKYLKKFSKAFKDAVIVKFEEVSSYGEEI